MITRASKKYKNGTKSIPAGLGGPLAVKKLKQGPPKKV
jgi:hypothetical protein